MSASATLAAVVPEPQARKAVARASRRSRAAVLLAPAFHNEKDAFNDLELDFFAEGDQLASCPAELDTFEDLAAGPRRTFWQRLLGRR